MFRICPIFYTVEGHVYLFTYTDDQYDDILVVLEKHDAASSEAGTAYASGALEVTTVFCGVRCCSIFSFLCTVVFRSLFVRYLQKKHYIDCLRLELGLDSLLGNPSYTATTLSKNEIIDNHMSVLSSFGIFHER